LVPISPSLITQSSLFGIGIAFSPLHIGVVTLLLLGRDPLRRSFAYVLGWSLANLLAVALGLYQLTPQAVLGEEGMALRMMNRLPQMATGALVLVGAAGALLTPENLVFYLKEAGLLLINHPGLRADVEVSGLFVLAASSLLLLPPLAWIASGGSIRAPIAALEEWLQHRAEWLVGVLALLFALYLFYEGLHGLHTLAGG
jgi:hypothetical protein